MVDPAPASERTIFILEHPEDVAEYMKICNTVGGSHILIAATPDATWELEKRGVQFKGIENYYDSREIYELGISNYDKLDQLCSDIDSLLQKQNPMLKKYGFRPALDNFH